jgi:hypothetical protein
MAGDPHHLSGPPPPATAVLEIGVRVAPNVSVAAASAIASIVFLFPLLECSTLSVATDETLPSTEGQRAAQHRSGAGFKRSG